MPLTELSIRALQPRDRPYKVTDAGGLHLLVTPAGGRLWRFKFRFEGREKLLSIGAYPIVTLKAAREARDVAKRRLSEGRDPAAEKAQASGRAQEALPEPSVTFADIAREYMEKMQREGRAEATIAKNQWLLDLANADFGSRPIREIDAATVLDTLRGVERRGRYESARRLRSVIGGVFRYAVATTRADTDPTFALQGALTRPIVKPRPAITEEKAFGGLLRAVWGYHGYPEVVAALKLAAILAPRPGELRQAEWNEFDLAGSLWTIPAHRAKMRRPHRVPLAPVALSLLADLKEQARSAKFVFPSLRSVERPISENTLNAALRQMGYGKEDATAHGFRASFSTIANESNLWNPDAIERALGHVEKNDVRAAYARGQFWEDRVRLAAWWETKIEQLRDRDG